MEKVKKQITKYKTNPSINQLTLKPGVKLLFPQIQDSAYCVIAENLDTGDSLEKTLTVAFKKKIEKEPFVKIFQEGFFAISLLGEASSLFFSYVMFNISKEVGKDQVYLSYEDYVTFCEATKSKQASERTYFNSIKKILESRLLFKCTSTNLYFVNVCYLFNGDRIKFFENKKKEAAQNKSWDGFKDLRFKI